MNTNILKFGSLLLVAKILAIVIGITWAEYSYGCSDPAPEPNPVSWPKEAP